MKEKLALLLFVVGLVTFASCAGGEKVVKKDTVETTVERTPVIKRDSSRVVVDTLRFR